MSKLITVMLASAFGIALNTASAQNVDSDKYKQQDQGQSPSMDQDQSTTGAAGGQQDQSQQSQQQDDSSGMRFRDDSSTVPGKLRKLANLIQTSPSTGAEPCPTVTN